MRRVWVLLLLFATACGSAPVQMASERILAAPDSAPQPTAGAQAAIDPTGDIAQRQQTAAAEPEALSAPRAAAAPQAIPPAAPRILAAPLTKGAPAVPASRSAAFSGLGAWIDVYDYNNDPASIVPLVKQMAARGTKTLYLESGRFTAPTDIQFPKAMGAALDEAKARGLRVVAWYPPALDDVKRDVRRSLAAINFRSPKGNRFDAFGADIEYTERVPDHSERNKRAIDYSNKLRAGAGSSYPLAAIVIPPTSLEVNKTRWPGFPWSSLAKSYQLFMPMNYWTVHGKNAATAADLTKRNIQKTKALTGRPVHIIGGLGDSADPKQVAAYVKAVRDGGSVLGGGLYDFTTTRKDVWGELAKLNG